MNTHTHDKGPFLAFRLPKVNLFSRPVDLPRMWEDEKPYRTGRALLLHVPGLEMAWGVGYWRKAKHEDLNHALYGTPDPQENQGTDWWGQDW